MKMVLVPPSIYLAYFVCSGCHKRLVLGKGQPDVYADLDGEAFKAYYCPPCMMKATYPQDNANDHR